MCESRYSFQFNKHLSLVRKPVKVWLVLGGTFTPQMSEPRPRSPSWCEENHWGTQFLGFVRKVCGVRAESKALPPHSSYTRAWASFIQHLDKWSSCPLTPSQGQFCRTLKSTAADQFLPIFLCIGKKSDKRKSSQLSSCPQRSPHLSALGKLMAPAVKKVVLSIKWVILWKIRREILGMYCGLVSALEWCPHSCFGEDVFLLLTSVSCKLCVLPSRHS